MDIHLVDGEVVTSPLIQGCSLYSIHLKWCIFFFGKGLWLVIYSICQTTLVEDSCLSNTGK